MLSSCYVFAPLIAQGWGAMSPEEQGRVVGTTVSVVVMILLFWKVYADSEKKKRENQQLNKPASRDRPTVRVPKPQQPHPEPDDTTYLFTKAETSVSMDDDGPKPTGHARLFEAALWFAGFAYSLVTVAILSLLFTRDEPHPVFMGGLAFLSLLAGVSAIVTAVNFRRGRPWIRWLVLVPGILLLPLFPFGTILGAVILATSRSNDVVDYLSACDRLGRPRHDDE